MSRGAKIVVAVLAVLVVLYAGVVGLVLMAGSGTGVELGGGGTVGVVHLDGVISADRSTGLTRVGGIDPEWTARTLKEADGDGSIDAVVLRVNSPGGSPAASWEVYRALRDMEKPVVVSVGDVAASGAYYFASGADSIVAAPGSQVGSIGVVLSALDLEELLDEIGVRYTVITKGKYKDLGHVARGMSDEERRILDEQLGTIYEQFINDVAAGRENLDESQVRSLATGLTYPGEEALDLGLIDELGTYHDALDEAAELAGLDPQAYEVEYLDEDAGAGLLSLLLGLDASGWLERIGAGFAGALVNSTTELERFRFE